MISNEAKSLVLADIDPRCQAPRRVHRPGLLNVLLLLHTAGTLSTTARRVAAAVRMAGDELTRHAAAPPTPAQRALLAARRHAGTARVELRAALADRSARQPGAFTAELPSHPALAPPPRASGLHR